MSQKYSCYDCGAPIGQAHALDCVYGRGANQPAPPAEQQEGTRTPTPPVEQPSVEEEARRIADNLAVGFSGPCGCQSGECATCGLSADAYKVLLPLLREIERLRDHYTVWRDEALALRKETARLRGEGDFFESQVNYWAERSRSLEAQLEEALRRAIEQYDDVLENSLGTGRADPNYKMPRWQKDALALLREKAALEKQIGAMRVAWRNSPNAEREAEIAALRSEVSQLKADLACHDCREFREMHSARLREVEKERDEALKLNDEQRISDAGFYTNLIKKQEKRTEAAERDAAGLREALRELNEYTNQLELLAYDELERINTHPTVRKAQALLAPTKPKREGE